MVGDYVSVRASQRLERMGPNANAEQKLAFEKEFSTSNPWADYYSDQESLNAFEENIQKSRLLKEECRDLNVLFVNTSIDFETAIFEAYKKLRG